MFVLNTISIRKHQQESIGTYLDLKLCYNLKVQILGKFSLVNVDIRKASIFTLLETKTGNKCYVGGRDIGSTLKLILYIVKHISEVEVK